VQAKAVEVQAWGSINQQMAEINKAVMEHPELYPYFNEGKKCRRSDKIYPKVASMADMYLDFIDQFDDDYVRGLAGMKDGGKYWLAWEKYFQDQFKLAPALCARYEEVRSWYVEKGLVDTLAKQGCNQVDQKK
jgi:hypothetical protein